MTDPRNRLSRSDAKARANINASGHAQNVPTHAFPKLGFKTAPGPRKGLVLDDQQHLCRDDYGFDIVSPPTAAEKGIRDSTPRARSV